MPGGQHAPLVETMRLREAAGTVLDHLYISETFRVSIKEIADYAHQRRRN